MRPTYEQLEQCILEQQKLIQELRAEIAQLKSRLDKNSRNSSKPPSSDQKANSSKEKESQKRGPYHQGINRKLLPENMVTSCETRSLESCPRCHSKMEPTGSSSKWQQVDLPPIEPLVHQIELLTCRCTKCSFVAAPQLKESEIFLMGSRLEGFVNLLMAQFRQSHGAVRTFIELLIPGLKLSQGLISKTKKRGSKAFDHAAMQLQEEILASTGPKFVDATGWRHMARNWNALIVRTPELIRYFLVEKQNGMVLAEILGEGPHSLVSDRGLATKQIALLSQQYCLAHFLRNITGLAENPEVTLRETQTLGEIHETLQGLFHDRNRYQRGELSRSSWRQYGYEKWAWMRETFEDLLSNSSCSILKRFCKRALSDWKSFMVYLSREWRCNEHPI